MTRWTMLLSLAAFALSATVGCSFLKKKEEAPPPEEPVVVQEDAEVWEIPEPDGGLVEPTDEAESTAAADALLEQMKADEKNKLEITEEFKKTGKKFKAKNCIEGKIDGISVIMCEYEDADKAKENLKEAEEYAKGASTGVVYRNGKTVLATKATKEEDKNNKKVNKILKAFSAAK